MPTSRRHRLPARLRSPATHHVHPMPPEPQDSVPLSSPNPDWAAERHRMVRQQLESPNRGITHPLVLRAMATVPRHAFVPPDLLSEAYADHPLPIGFHQTISQPFIVALMTEALDPRPTDRVLEIGTGSGYQTAVLAGLVHEIHTVEIVPQLARAASITLRRLGIHNVTVHGADGFLGWPEAAPYDAIIVTCAPHRIPSPLVDQLREGGRMIVPVGDPGDGQDLIRIQKDGSHLETRHLLAVRFVPMTGVEPRI